MKSLTCKNWTDFSEFIDTANKQCNWLVLRNHEFLPDNFFGNDKDVDILCEDIEHFVTTMGLVKRSYGIGAYQTMIEGQIVPFDIRFLGDGYYDKLWQDKMLKTKVFTEHNVPKMNDEHYFYSLIYHSKIQKFEVKEVYKARFLELASRLKVKDYTLNSISDDVYIASLLDNFMKQNYFTYTTPIDTSVPKNTDFFNLLSDYVKQDGDLYSPIVPKSYARYVPKPIIKIIPRTAKDLIKRLLPNAT